MKNFIIFIICYMIILSFCFAAELSDSACATCNMMETIPAYAVGMGGEYFTAHGDVHALAVFVEFPDDKYDTTSFFWPKGQPPVVLNTFFDSESVYPSGAYNISNYFREMSMTGGSSNQLNLTGDGVHVIAPHSRSWYVSNSKRLSSVTKDVLLKLDSLNFDFSPYDNWHFGSSQGAHYPVSGGDGQIDMIYMIYRNVDKDNDYYREALKDNYGVYNWSGYAGLGYSENLLLPNNLKYAKGWSCWSNSSGIVMATIRFDFNIQGSRNINTFIHELGHFFGFGHHAYSSTMPALMGASNNASYTIHPYERERLNWMTYTEVTSNQVDTLPDYVTTGSAIKLKVGSSVYVYVTNHQEISQFDIPNGNYSAPGIYITTINGTTISMLSAKGNYNWVFDGDIQNPWDVPGTTIPVFKTTSENRTGQGYRDLISAGGRSGYLHAYYDDNGNLRTDIHRCFGTNEDYFDDDTDNFMISQ